MTARQPSKPASPAELGHRRSIRFPVVVPVEVVWSGQEGKSFREPARATEVNVQGGILHMKTCPPVGSEIEVVNTLSSDTTQARVVALRRGEAGAEPGVAVELLVPSETFWGVTFRLKRATSELHKLEQAIKSGGMDLRALREFRDAVDYIRKTAWVVHEWRERQIQGKDAETVLSMLTLERIRRATQLTNDLSADLDSQEVTHNTSGVAELARAVQGLYLRVTALLKSRKAP